MKTCKQIADEWKLSERTVAALCKSGKISGVKKNGKSWQIPDDAKKPADGRVASGKYIKTSEKKKKPLPIGVSDYVRAQSEYYYVDKTMLIKEFLDQKPLVSLFTRPRRFGKTLNMDMLRVFFEKRDEDTSIYFKDKAIWKCGETYTKHQGAYPVIFLTFKDVKFDTWSATMDKIKALLQAEFGRHMELQESPKVAEYEKQYFTRILSGNASEVDLTSALENLSKMLTEHYGKAPIIIVDEYDTPIQEGYTGDFYDEIIGFMRNFFSGAFKDNKNISYGFLTGILRIAQESIFSGLNNLTVNSVMDSEYDEYFGFTYREVHEMLQYYGKAEKEAELKEWYDGYLFGNQEIYNPWSVINYIAKGCIPQAYWVNTGKNEVLEDVLKIATDDIKEKLYGLLQGEKVIARIDQNVVYRSLNEDPANIYSLLLVAGYLKTPRKELQMDGTYLCEVSIPNKEIAAVYKNEILLYLPCKKRNEGKMTAKQQIRKKYKTLRNEMSDSEVREKSAQICKNIISSELFQNAEKILAYAPLGNEVDIRPVIKEGWRQNKRIAFPNVFGDTMKYFEISDFSELEEGTFHVMEPKEDHPVDWSDALVLVPGVAFDKKKNRMGYGKGYYDRFFEGKSGCVELGVAYELQIAEQLPVEENDLPMAYLVTEENLW